MTGATIYTGETGVGKTTGAINDQREAAASTGFPMLTLDLQGAENWKSEPHARDLAAVVDALCGTPARSVVWTPEDGSEDFDNCMKLLDQWPRRDGRRHGFHVLVDEMYLVCNRRKISKAFTSAVRGWRHSRTTWHCTTQRIADIHEDFYSVTPLRIRVYKTGSKFKGEELGPDLEFLRKRFGLDPAAAKALPVGKCLEV